MRTHAKAIEQNRHLGHFRSFLAGEVRGAGPLWGPKSRGSSRYPRYPRVPPVSSATLKVGSYYDVMFPFRLDPKIPVLGFYFLQSQRHCSVGFCKCIVSVLQITGFKSFETRCDLLRTNYRVSFKECSILEIPGYGIYRLSLTPAKIQGYSQFLRLDSKTAKIC